MKVKYLNLLAILAIVFVSCNGGKSKQSGFDYGTIERGVYRNSYFNFSMKTPTDWATLTAEQNRSLMNSGGNTDDASKITTVILLTASLFELGKSDTIFNPNMLILAENINGNTRIRNASDYLILTRQVLDKEPVTREYPDKTATTQQINATNFATMRVITTDSNKTYSQSYYTTLIDNFALTAILTFATEDERIVLENALGTWKFRD